MSKEINEPEEINNNQKIIIILSFVILLVMLIFIMWSELPLSIKSKFRIRGRKTKGRR